jgi:hypothetical protein
LDADALLEAVTTLSHWEHKSGSQLEEESGPGNCPALLCNQPFFDFEAVRPDSASYCGGGEQIYFLSW